MIKKTISFIMIIMLMFVVVSELDSFKAFAQGSTKILVTSDKTEYKVGDTIKISVQAQNVVELFGLQFTLHYDPSVLEMQADGINLEGDYTIFGGTTVDTKKGILTYPLINQGATTDKKDSEVVGNITFKAIKKAPVIITMDNIKAVNKKSEEINYNTQTQTVFNILEQAVTQPSNSNTSSTSTNPGTTVAPANTSNASSQKSSTGAVAKTETLNSTNTEISRDVSKVPAASEQQSNNTEKAVDKSNFESNNTIQVSQSNDKLAEVKTNENNTMGSVILIILLVQVAGTFMFIIINKNVLVNGRKFGGIKVKQESGEI